ncbi:transposase [Streptomyces sp. MMS24-I31]|uniref:transposase n=1 Tax=Streptomyces sp. MMS24-I31 TaxID=3351563 RepID=UPI003896B873
MLRPGPGRIRRRTDFVGVFPCRDTVLRQVFAVLAEHSDEWTEQRHCVGPDILAHGQGTASAATNGPRPGTSQAPGG